MYDDVRQVASPGTTLLEFMQSAYEAERGVLAGTWRISVTNVVKRQPQGCATYRGRLRYAGSPTEAAVCGAPNIGIMRS